MNELTKATAAVPALQKADPTQPALVAIGREALAIRAGTTFNGRLYAEDTPVMAPDGGFEPGGDYIVLCAASPDGPMCARALTIPMPIADILGGFHFAPGSNAAARAGGDSAPQINACSLWDRNFRPACPDPRGMTLVTGPRGFFWCDIYLTAADHLDGTSCFGVTIADGDDPPQTPGGGRFKKFDYETAVAVMQRHGKGLLAVDEFFAAAFGVTEKTACRSDPEKTGLDSPRTSRFGLMQATGNLWVWGHDGDPHNPRASIFGGYWWGDGYAGSRYARVACNWPDDSSGYLGARGRGDHLQLG